MPARGSKSSAPTTAPLTATEVPVTSAMLGSVRTELLERIDQARNEAKADTQKLEAKIEAVDAKVDAVDAKIDAVRDELKAEIHEVRAEFRADFHEVKAGMHSMRAVMHGMQAGIHGVQAQVGRIELLVEEQNARNKVVLDGITALLSRQNQVEERVSQVEETVRKLASAQPAAEPA